MQNPSSLQLLGAMEIQEGKENVIIPKKEIISGAVHVGHETARGPLRDIFINTHPGSNSKNDPCPAGAIASKQCQQPELNITEEYCMNHRQRGKHIIFSHSKFDDFLLVEPRTNSHLDVAKLQSTFEELGFTTLVFRDWTKQKILDEIINLSKEDFSDVDCLWITVLTHGMHKNYILAKDSSYHFDELWKPFTRCKSLAGKPKIFAIQACRGEQMDPGIRFSAHSETDIAKSSYNIPTHADFLLIFSSVEGFVSFRDVTCGSWLIYSLCEELRKNSSRLDLGRMLTNVTRMVASYQPETGEVNSSDKKQVPCIISMLRKEVYLRPKN